MHSADPIPHKAGMSLHEVLISTFIFTLLGAAIWGHLFSHGRSFRYNLGSNANIQEASLALNRIVYGNNDRWGLRTASRQGVTVSFTGLSGANGALGWSAVCRHNIVGENLPDALDIESLNLVFNPVDRTISVNNQVLARRVANSYFSILNGEVSLGVQVETDSGSLQSMVETRVRLRNP